MTRPTIIDLNHVELSYYPFMIILDKCNWSCNVVDTYLKMLKTKMFKIHCGLSPDILREIFLPKLSSYNFRRNNTFERR